MRLNFHQILHQMRFKLLKSTTPANYTPLLALPNSDQLIKTSFLKKIIQSIYKSRSKAIKFSAGRKGSVLKGFLSSKRTDPAGLFHRKKFLIALFTLIFISIPIAFLSLKYARPTIAAWFDDSWAFRKAIAIPSHTTAENNVYVTVPTFDATDTSKFQSDCGDLRFTKQNGELLPYYVVDCDATATVHVQFDTLPAGASTYFMYYGNPSAQNGFSSADFSSPASGLGSQTLAAEEKSAGPAAYWKFDEGYGTTANDSTRNANNGSLGVGTSAPEWRPESDCLSGKCLSFDGSNDYVDAGDILDSSSTMSWGGWFKANSFGSTGILMKRIGSTEYGQYALSAYSGTLYCLQSSASGDWQTLVSTSVPSTGNWHHAICTNDGSIARMYLDGIQVGTPDSTPATSLAASTETLKIGYARVASADRYFNGFIDDIKIYPYARTAAQIKSDFKSRGTTKGTSAALGASKDSADALSNGLFRYWKMDESVANTCTGGVNDSCDSSGNASNGAWNGDTTSTTGKFSNGTTYDGTGDYVDIPDYNPGTDNFTLAAWFNLSSADSASGNPHAIFGNDQNTPMLGYTPSSKTFSQLRQYSGGSETLTFSATSSNLADSLWHHVVVTIDQQTYKVRLYVDGTFLQEKSIGTEGYTHSNGAFQKIGVGYIPSATTFWKGSIDEVRVYKRVLSGKEVRDLYNWAPGPVAHLKMDEGSGVSANDDSGNGRIGTLNDGASWSTGKFGKGVKLDGTNNDISINDFGY